MSTWGSYLQKNAQHPSTGKRKAAAKKSSDVVWVGTHTTIRQSDLNLAKIFYRLSGQSEEDAYWVYEKQVYQKDLPIMKMNQNNEAAFYKKHPGASEADYQKWFSGYKQDLVEKEAYREVQ